MRAIRMSSEWKDRFESIHRELVNGATDADLTAEQFGTDVRRERFPNEDELYFPKELGGGPLNLDDDRCPQCGARFPGHCSSWCDLARHGR